jgi:hypothetical protein
MNGQRKEGSAQQTGLADQVPSAITGLVWCLGAGLFAAAQCLPVHWPAGQTAAIWLLLFTLPAAMVFGELRLTRMVGLASNAFASRLRLTSLAAVALLAVALPVYAGQHGGGTPGNDLLITVLIGAGLSLLVRGMAATLAQLWTMLSIQLWERNDTSAAPGSEAYFESAGRVERTVVMRQLWQWWLGGDVALATALLLCTQAATSSHAWEQGALLLALLLYTALGLLVLSQAARLRQTIVWELDGVAVSPTLSQRWNGLSLQAATLAVAGTCMLILFHVLDVIYAAEYWIFWHVLAPIINWIGSWLGHSQPLRGCTQLSFCQAPSAPRLPHLGTLHGAPATTHMHGPDWSWLERDWPLLLALVALLFLARGFLGARRQGGGRALWREILAILARDLGLLARLALQFFRRRAAAAGQAIRERAGSALQRRGAGRARSAPAGARETVIALYLTALAYAARRGHPRRAGQTPREYARDLAGAVPEAGTDLTGMTDLFVEVRYGNVPATGEQITHMQRLWGSFRRMLPRRGTKHHEQSRPGQDSAGKGVT